jgi:hypothetical protein
MKYAIIILLALSAFKSSAQKPTDFVELTDGDTLWGNVWGVEPTELRFQAKGHEGVSHIALPMVESYMFFGEIRQVGGTVQLEGNVMVNKYPEEEKLHIAGLKLQSSAKRFYAGAAIGIVGTIISITGAVVSADGNTNIGQPLIYVGTGTALIGTFVSMSAFFPINEAGIQLKSIKLGK